MIWLYIAAGGAVGAMPRYGVAGWVQERGGFHFPWGTLAVNILGSALIGASLRYLEIVSGRPCAPDRHRRPGPLEVLAAVGRGRRDAAPGSRTHERCLRLRFRPGTPVRRTDVRVPRPDNTGNDQAPAWSSDGRKIAYFSTRDGNAEVYVMRADGTDQVRLTTNDEWDFMPAWSPDGRSIVFDSRRTGRRAIYTVNADGSGPRILTNREPSEFVAVATRESVDEAIRRLEISVARNPALPYFLFAEMLALGRGRIEQGAVDEGLAVLRINVEHNPDDAHGWVVLGEACETHGNRDEAAAAFDRALSIDPDNARATAGRDRVGRRPPRYR